MGVQILTFQPSLLSLWKFAQKSRIAFPRSAGSIILISMVDAPWQVRRLNFAFHTMNTNVFVPLRCCLKWQPWSARGVSLETCDKNRIRKCARPRHPHPPRTLPSGCGRRVRETGVKEVGVKASAEATFLRAGRHFRIPWR